MFDCSKDIIDFHDDKVTLIQVQRTQMRNRRDANRDRLLCRLKSDSKPIPCKFIKQGSYAMKTMVQDPDNDYDIDDGVYFTRESLQDENGNDMLPINARQIVCDALQDNRFKRQPEVRHSCVRIYYNEGYHVDMPVYRITTTSYSYERYELANGDEWIESRAADVEEWFDRENQSKSPDESNGRQLRRIVRMLKKFARSRSIWKDNIATGFTITKLVTECYMANIEREDNAFRETMQQIHNRLIINLEVNHPVTSGAKLTKGTNDTTTALFRDKLGEALEELKMLDNANCTQEQALAAWDQVFNTIFFSARCTEVQKNALASVNTGVLANLIATKHNPRAVDKRGGGRFA